MCSRKETIGEVKVGVFDQPIDSLKLARDIADRKDAEDCDEPYMVVNLDTLLQRFVLWKKALPHVEPFYAVKCNTDEVLLRVLASLGCGFDCASKEEIDIVMSIGVDPSRIIYANPCKTRSFIKHAEKRDVRLMTFDNAEELEKVGRLHASAQMILRIAVSDPTATCPLNLKFGAEPVHAAPKLLLKAKQLGINVCGVSFHVGSGCNDAGAYDLAIAHARRLFDIGESMGHNMEILDLGGGFPGGEHHTSFEEIAGIIKSALCRHFPDPDVKIVAEPGRFFSAAPFTLCANVIHATEVPAEKITKNDDDIGNFGMMYYLNDGVYGSFNCILFDHVHPIGHPLKEESNSNETMITTIWGPTCDSLDLIEDKKLMRRLEVGDWVVYNQMGAYTCAASTTFNGFQRPTSVYCISQASWETIADVL